MKSRIIAILMLIAAAVALITATQVSAKESDPTTSQAQSADKSEMTFTGRMIVGNDSYIIIDDKEKSPIVMSVNGSEEDFFAGYNTGDRVEVMTDMIAESYPAQTHVYHIKLLEKGSQKDIPFDVLSSLREFGWIN